MNDLQDNYNIALQIICPTNHQNFQEINDKFGKSLCRVNPIHSIDDFGQFYKDCLDDLRILKSDMVICLGDRWEMLAAATAALLLNIPIAHIHGGEVTTGAFDNELRNAITMMADIHFTSNYDYSMNLCKMGINGLKVFTVGSPGLDYIHRAKLLSKQELQQRVLIDLNQPFIVACFHPVTKELGRTKEHIKSLIEAMEALKTQVLWIGPNIDPGFTKIIQKVNEKLGWVDGWVGVDNLDHLTYLSLLQFASFMVGNSSSGIIESASFSIPSVTVGSRQDGRIKASNTFSCPCETEAILTAIDRAREWNATVGKCDNPYGDGNSSRKIVEVLENV
jgi:UDP-hydrolysing UDP-N-acetyl-D-glucosamine 2-epimerase